MIKVLLYLLSIACFCLETSFIAHAMKKKEPKIFSYVQGNTHTTRYIDIPEGKAAIIKLPRASRDVIIANPALLDVVVRSPYEVYFFAKQVGLTNAFFFDEAGKQIVNLEINVGLDVKALERVLKDQLPKANLKVSSMGDTIILSGTVNNGMHAKIAENIAGQLSSSAQNIINNIGISGQEQVMIKVKVSEIARTILKQLGIDWNTAFNIGSFEGGLGLINSFPGDKGLVGSSSPVNRILSGAIGNLPGFSTVTRAQSYLTDILEQIGSAESVISENQDAIAALLDPSNLPEDGVDPVAFAQYNANQVAQLQAEINAANQTIGTLTPQVGELQGAVNTTQNPLGQRTIGYRGKRFATDSLITALEQHSLIKTLAEPNLTALSGESATFLAGGEFPFIASQALGGASVDFKPYGIGLAFTPTILDEGRISLKISTEISELGASISTSNGTFPSLEVRRAETTVEMPSGGAIVMAGLIRENARRNLDTTPGIKDVPVLGPLFRSNQFQSNETELAILVAPYIVKPTDERKLKLPTDGYANPSDIDMYARGRLAAVYKENQPKETPSEWLSSVRDNNALKNTINHNHDDHILE